MYGLPKDFSALIFVGQELVEICFTVNTAHLVFDGEVSITLLSSYVYTSSSNNVSRKETVPVLSSSLMHLIGKKVSSATAKTDGTLTLMFEDGASLILLDDSRDYESYSIRIGDREIVV
jgi:hypothetical protein